MGDELDFRSLFKCLQRGHDAGPVPPEPCCNCEERRRTEAFYLVQALRPRLIFYTPSREFVRPLATCLGPLLLLRPPLPAADRRGPPRPAKWRRPCGVSALHRESGDRARFGTGR